MFQGRAAERAEVERLVAGAGAGTGGAAVIRGEAGIGKTVLLDHAADAADGALVLRCAGSPPEAEQPFASLELMLRPVRDLGGPEAERLRALIEPQAEAGREDVFAVRRAVLALLHRLAADRPVVCLVDDAQWLDAASADALAYAARRLGAEPAALLAAARDESTFGSSGLAEIRLRRLCPEEAAAFLRGTAAGAGLAPPARDRVLAEAEGNPLALRLLAASLSPAQRAGCINPFTFHDGASPVGGTLQAELCARLGALPPGTRALLLLAAADDTRDTARVTGAAASVGATVADFAPAERAGLLAATRTTIAFAHPLVRAVAYHRATPSERRAAHRALADSAGAAHPEARTWHLAAASLGYQADVAAELERAGACSGDRRAYVCHARAAELTAGERARARRLAAAARAACAAGLFDGARDLVARARRLAADPLTRAELARAGAAAEAECGSPRRAARTLVAGAAPLAGLDPAGAALLLADAARCGWHAGDARLIREALDALGALPLPPGSALARLPAAIGAAMDAAGAAGRLADLRRSLPDELGRRLTASTIAFADGAPGAHEAAARFARDCRTEAGRLPYALQVLAHALIGRGLHGEAREAAEEGLRLAGDAGARTRTAQLSCLLGWLAAVAGDEKRCADLVAAGLEQARAEDVAPAVSLGTWALALLDLGAGRHAEALARLEELPEEVPAAGPAASAARQAADRVEAAVRAGRPDRAARPLALLDRRAARDASPDVRALAERCRAQLAAGAAAERHFVNALELLGNGNAYERARTGLLYGEWLRRERRRADARTHLSNALELFEKSGSAAWAERARAELGACGTRPADAPETVLGGLTHQELQIVRLAAAGASNREIADRLFLSPRTVGNHLYRAYPKLGVRTRGELGRLDLSAPAAPRERPAAE